MAFYTHFTSPSITGWQVCVRKVVYFLCTIHWGIIYKTNVVPTKPFTLLQNAVAKKAKRRAITIKPQDI